MKKTIGKISNEFHFISVLGCRYFYLKSHLQFKRKNLNFGRHKKVFGLLKKSTAITISKLNYEKTKLLITEFHLKNIF